MKSLEVLRDMPQSQVNRFWTKVAITANDKLCWNWTANKNKKGYGSFSFYIDANKSSDTFRSNRVSFFMTNGYIDDEKLICHSCDNPSCVNPKHLFIGTQSENMLDMFSKGRGIPRRGALNFNAKLTVDDLPKIFELKELGWKYTEIAKHFSVNPSQISRIFCGKRWIHATDKLLNKTT